MQIRMIACLDGWRNGCPEIICHWSYTRNAMVIRNNSGHWLLVTQPAHAWISGQIAENWGRHGFAIPPPWRELCLAASRHDDGWISRDIQPVLNPDTGLPYDFKNIPIDDHMSIWEQSATLVEPVSRFAALLVSMHVMGLFSMHDFTRDPEPIIGKARRFKSRQQALQKRLIADLEAGSAHSPFIRDKNLEQHRRLVSAFDYLSLFLILGESDEAELGEIPLDDGGLGKIRLSREGADRSGHAAGNPEPEKPETWAVTPWPFVENSIQLCCDAIRLDKRCADQQELDRAMQQGRRVLFRAKLLPGS